MNEFWDWFSTIKDKLGNRKDTFTKIFEYLDKFERQVCIIETGCCRQIHNNEDDAWRGDGQSTVLFDHYIQANGGVVYSVDIDPDHVSKAKAMVSRAQIHTGDSVEYLKLLAKRGVVPDLVYLDSLDWMEQDPFHTALHCANEFFSIRPVLRSDTLVVCDDTPSVFDTAVIPHLELCGKGMFVGHHARAVGADILFNSWQTGWTNMTGSAARTTDQEVDQLIGRARTYVEANQAEAAERCYRAVIHKTRPCKSGVDRVARGEACAFYARTAASIGQYGTASDWYRDAIISDPRCVDYRLELVTRAYRPLLNWRLAEQECRRAVEIEPDNPHAWRIMGDVAMTVCDVPLAIKCYDKEMELSPDDPHAMLDRCVIALDTADYDTVRKLVEKVMKTDRYADGLHVSAMIENRMGNHEAAIPLFDKAIEAGCNNIHTAHWNKSLSLHAIGRFREGWIEHEHRRHQADNPALSIAFHRFTRPLWEGEPPPALIHVHAESGIGDNICFSRFLNVLAAKGYKLRYEVHEELMDLMKRSFPDVEVVKRAPDYPGAIGISNFDYHLPLGSMAYALDIDIDTVPWDGPYLKPRKGDYTLPRKGKKIGLCWSSGIRDYGIWLTEYGRRKSMHYDQVEPIVEQVHANGDRVVNLQIGPERSQHGGRIIDPLPEKPSWDDTAALIQNLDLVITVDTGVAHLAGAMGKPVWVMCQRDCASFHFMCWREGASWNEASPWYPSARLFRQHRLNTMNNPHFWDEVTADIVRELKDQESSDELRHRYPRAAGASQ